MSEHQQSYGDMVDRRELNFYRQRIVELIAEGTKINSRLTHKRRELLEAEQSKDLAKLLLSGLEIGSYYYDY